MTPNTVGKMESRLGAPPIKMPSFSQGNVPGTLQGGVVEGLQGHEFSHVPYSLVSRGIGGTTRQFGGI